MSDEHVVTCWDRGCGNKMASCFFLPTLCDWHGLIADAKVLIREGVNWVPS